MTASCDLCRESSRLRFVAEAEVAQLRRGHLRDLDRQAELVTQGEARTRAAEERLEGLIRGLLKRPGTPEHSTAIDAAHRWLEAL